MRCRIEGEAVALRWGTTTAEARGVTEPIYSWSHGIYARSLRQIHLTLVDPGFPERYKAQICIRQVPYDLCLEDRPIVPFARLHVHVKSSSPKSVRYQEHSYAGSGWISFRPLLLVQQGFNVDSSRLTGSSVKGNLWPSGTILYGSLLNPLRFDHLARGTGSIGTADSLLGYATIRRYACLGP